MKATGLVDKRQVNTGTGKCDRRRAATRERQIRVSHALISLTAETSIIHQTTFSDRLPASYQAYIFQNILSNQVSGKFYEMELYVVHDFSSNNYGLVSDKRYIKWKFC